MTGHATSGHPPLFAIRGQVVILDADIAAFFDRTVKSVNQVRARNAPRFPEDYAFQLSDKEWKDLKSRIVTASPDEGRVSQTVTSSQGGDTVPLNVGQVPVDPRGSQIVTSSVSKFKNTAPWAYTEYGFVMLAMSFRGPEADRIARVVTETFIAHRKGVLPAERVLQGADAPGRRNALRVRIMDMLDAIAAMPLPGGSSASDELRSSTAKALDRVRAWLDKPKLENVKLEAEISKLLAETRRAYAEIDKMDAETAHLWADTVLKRLDAVRQLRDMAAQIERDDLGELLEAQFDPAQAIAIPSDRA